MVYRTLDIYRRIPVTARSKSITEVLLRDGKYVMEVQQNAQAKKDTRCYVLRRYIRSKSGNRDDVSGE